MACTPTGSGGPARDPDHAPGLLVQEGLRTRERQAELFATMSAWWKLGGRGTCPRPTGPPVHGRTAALEQLNPRHPAPGARRAWWSVNPPAHSGGRWTGRAAGPPYRTREAATRVMPGVQSIGTIAVQSRPGDYIELIARQTSGSAKNVAADELTWFATELVE